MMFRDMAPCSFLDFEVERGICCHKVLFSLWKQEGPPKRWPVSEKTASHSCNQ